MSDNATTIAIVLVIAGGCVGKEFYSRVSKNRKDEKIIRQAEELKKTEHLYQSATQTPPSGNYGRKF